MGHLGHLKEEYQSLLRRLDAGQVGLPEPSDEAARQGWRDLLEIFYTPREAELASRLPMMPASLRKIAARLRVKEEDLKPKLDAMCDKGLVMDLVNPTTGKTKYMLAPPVVGFFEFSMMRAHDMYDKKRVAEAMHAYMHGDRAFAEEVFGHDTVVGRAVVHEGHLSADAIPDILDWERATSLIHDASVISVSMCYCRHKAEHLGEACDVPVETCLSINAGAEFVARRNFGRTIERGEALDILEAARGAGLVQIADNVKDRPSYLCNCCGCCCGQLRAISDFDLQAVNPSGFKPEIDLTTCKGCSRCSRACPIGAITMVPLRVTGKVKGEMRPIVNDDRCIGCGVCAGACRSESIEMERRSDQPHVPQNAIEKAVRTSLEKGRLAQLVFDEGESRGAAFLAGVVQAVSHLPGPKQALASEHLQSRFVAYALANVRDPSAG